MLYAFRKYLRQSHANQEPDKPQSLEGKDADSFLAEARLKAETPATTEPTVSTLQRANHANSTDTHSNATQAAQETEFTFKAPW